MRSTGMLASTPPAIMTAYFTLYAPWRQREALRAEEHVHRPQKVVLVDQEAQDRERGKRSFGEQQDDAEEDLEAVGPVYEGRLLQLQRQRYEELPQKEDPERPGRPRYN